MAWPPLSPVTGPTASSGDNGPAISAQLGGDTDDGGPSGIAVDSTGNVYIADTYNSRIRKVSNGVITTVAGGSTATQLTDPTFIAVDSAGALYLSDPSNSFGFLGDRLRKVANGVVTTIAGNGYFSFSGDNGPAANAQFYQPEGVAIDSAGRMYIADTQNNRVRMIANGVITTVAGTGSLGFSGDNGPATSAQLATPVAVAVDRAGNLYIADINNFRIRKVSGGIITTVAGTVGSTPCGVAADSAGNVYVSDWAHSRLLKVSNGNATTLPAYGSGLTLDSAGNLYMTNAGAIFELSNGVVTTIGGGTGVAFDSAANRYIVDGNLGLVRKLSNGSITIFPMSPPLAFPGDPTRADSSGNIYDANNIGSAGILPPVGIAVDSSGNIYSSDGIHIVVLKPAGAIAPPHFRIRRLHQQCSQQSVFGNRPWRDRVSERIGARPRATRLRPRRQRWIVPDPTERHVGSVQRRFRAPALYVGDSSGRGRALRSYRPHSPSYRDLPGSNLRPGNDSSLCCGSRAVHGGSARAPDKRPRSTRTAPSIALPTRPRSAA